eukprot:776194-Pleurochrysis_carterae.AAC.2
MCASPTALQQPTARQIVSAACARSAKYCLKIQLPVVYVEKELVLLAARKRQVRLAINTSLHPQAVAFWRTVHYGVAPSVLQGSLSREAQICIS